MPLAPGLPLDEPARATSAPATGASARESGRSPRGPDFVSRIGWGSGDSPALRSTTISLVVDVEVDDTEGATTSPPLRAPELSPRAAALVPPSLTAALSPIHPHTTKPATAGSTSNKIAVRKGGTGRGRDMTADREWNEKSPPSDLLTAFGAAIQHQSRRGSGKKRCPRGGAPETPLPGDRKPISR